MAISASQLLGLVEIRGAAESIAKLEGVGRATDSAGAKLAGLAVGGTVLAGAALVALGAAAVKMDADLQQGVNRLRTGGGDIQDTFTSLRTGIQSVAVATGELTGPLIPAMYLIVGAGQRGAEAMNTLKVASEGAQIEQANVADVANVVSGVMTNYGTKLYNATQYMNGLIYAVAHGKITLQDLSVAMGPIDPIAQQLGIHMQDVAAAMTTQTNAMIPAARAATGLRFMMQALEKPTEKANAEMTKMGLDSVKVAEEMKVSLPGALQMIYDSAKKAGPEGSVPFNRAISDMIGGVRGFTAFTALTGPHMQAFINNTKNIGTAMNASTTQVKGWDIAQSNLNIKLDQGRAMLEVLGQNVGAVLMPYVSQLLAVVIPLTTSFGDWATSTQGLAGDINQLAAFVTYLVRDLQGNGAIKEFGAILSDIGSTVNNVVNTALLLLGTIFGTTASQAGKASDAATNVANGFKRVLDVIKPLTDAAAWLTQQFADSGVKGQILRDVLITIGGAIAGIKIAEFGSSFVTAMTNAGAAALGFGQKMVGVQAAATAASTATASAGTAAVASGTAFGGMGTSVKALGLALGPIIGIATGVRLALSAIPSTMPQMFSDMGAQVDKFTMSVGGMWHMVNDDTQKGSQKVVLDFHNMYQGATDQTTRLKSGVTLAANQMSSGMVETVTYLQTQASGQIKLLSDNGSNYSRNLRDQMTTNFFNMHKQVYSETSGLTSQALQLFKNLNGDLTDQMNSIDQNVIGYWNDIAAYIAGNPINGYVNISVAGTPAPKSATVRASAEGWPDSPGGWSWTGERGRELMYVPPGASIFPHQQSERMAAGGGGQPVQVNINIAGHNVARVLLPELVTAIRNGLGTVGL